MKRMYQTNKMCKDWLVKNGYDYIWLKPHIDARNARFKETYLTKDGVFYARDIYNLFDGICFDPQGILTFIQLSTTNYHPEKPYLEFIQDKKGFKIMMLRARKKSRKWIVETKLLRSRLDEPTQWSVHDVIPKIQPTG